MTDPLMPPELFAAPPLSDADLDALFDYRDQDGDTGPAWEPPAARWAVDGPNTAAWAMAKLAEAEAELAALDEQRQEYLLRIGYWFDHVTRTPQRCVEFFTGHLTRYAVAQREASGGKVKSVVTPAGVVKTTAHGPKVDIVDPAQVTAWAIDRAADIVQYPAPRVTVTDVREHVTILEVPTRVVLTCACIVEPTIPHDVAVWVRGTAKQCPSCGSDALVGDWIDTTLVVVDGKGDLVPGVAIVDGVVTAKVVTS